MQTKNKPKAITLPSKIINTRDQCKRRIIYNNIGSTACIGSTKEWPSKLCCKSIIRNV